MARASAGTIERNFMAPHCLVRGYMNINALWHAYNLYDIFYPISTKKNRRENLMAREQ